VSASALRCSELARGRHLQVGGRDYQAYSRRIKGGGAQLTVAAMHQAERSPRGCLQLLAIRSHGSRPALLCALRLYHHPLWLLRVVVSTSTGEMTIGKAIPAARATLAAQTIEHI
jgi:hypothetical protein